MRAALAAAVASGSLVAVQQRVNGALSDSLGDALLAALVSFGTGLLAVSLVVLSRPAARAAIGRIRTVPLWWRFGGLGGATLVAVGAAATPVVGVALLTVGLVAGQTVGGVVVDRVGIGPAGVRGLTIPRVAGAGLCLLAVAVSVTARPANAAHPVLLVLVGLAGFLVSLQQALNGRVRVATGQAAVATLLNFVVGTGALTLVVLGQAAAGAFTADRWPAEPWLYVGGPLGAVFVGVAAVTVGTLGVLRLALCVIAGQLAGAVLLDLVVPPPGTSLAAATVLGAALTLVAVGVSGLAPSRNRSAVPAGAGRS